MLKKQIEFIIWYNLHMSSDENTTPAEALALPKLSVKRRDINMQFLAEAIALTFIGGIIGVILGWLISYGVTSLGIINTQVSLGSVLLAFGVSAGIGIIFGYYPAQKASQLNPIDALRYE